MVEDTDHDGDVETIGKGQIVGARADHLGRRKAGEVASGALERTLVDVDRTDPAGAVGHRPQAVAAHAAPDIEKALVPPILRRQVDRPTAKLLLVVPSPAYWRGRRGLIRCVRSQPVLLCSLPEGRAVFVDRRCRFRCLLKSPTQT